MQLHQRIGAWLEAGYGARAGEVAAQLAVHFERAGEVQRAVHYWQQAGDNATRRHAHQDAIAAVTKGLALLATLPDSPQRTEDELTLQLTLGELLMAVKGAPAPEVGEVYGWAQRLCDQLGETSQRFRMLQSLFRLHQAQAQLHAAGALAQQLTQLALRQHDAGFVLEAQSAMGTVALFRGDLAAARTYLEPCLSCGALPPPSAPTYHGGHHLRVPQLVLMAQLLYAWRQLLGSTPFSPQRHLLAALHSMLSIRTSRVGWAWLISFAMAKPAVIAAKPVHTQALQVLTSAKHSR